MKISRKEFLKYCISSAVVLGIDQSTLGKLSKALAANTGPHILWLTGASCTGCTVSLANLVSTTAPVDVTDLLVNVISLDFHVNLMGAAGDQAVQNLRKIAAGSYILIVEGGIPTAFNGNTCVLWHENGQDVTALAAVKDLASHSIANISVGTCASFGGIAAAAPNPTQVASFSTAIGKPTINIPGCPTNPDWIVWTIAQLLAGNTPALDSSGRPSTLFGSTVHSHCPRRDSDDAGGFGRTGCMEGLGCKGPDTMANCPSNLWNNRVSTCINANALCIGCTESKYPDGFAPFFKVPTTNTIPVQLGLAVTSAAWDASNQVLTVAGSGKIGSQAVVRTSGGDLLATNMVNRTGKWAVQATGLATVPSSVLVQSDAKSVTATVGNAPSVKTFVVTSAVYSSTTKQITVAGTGKAGSTVTVNVTGGILLGAVTIPSNGSWALAVTSPATLPSRVTAVSDGVSLAIAVTGLPAGSAFAITSAAYSSTTKQITVAGTGKAGSTVTVNVTGGILLGAVTIPSNGSWALAVTSPATIPSSVTAVSDGVSLAIAVTGLPAGLTFAISSAAYSSTTKQITVNGTGSAGSTVAVSLTSGTVLGSVKIALNGSWTFSVASPTPIPPTIRAASNAVILSASVQGIPAPAGSLSILKAEWKKEDRKLTVQGLGAARATVNVYNSISGLLLGKVSISSDGKWSMIKSNISYVSKVRAVSNGIKVESSVKIV